MSTPALARSTPPHSVIEVSGLSKTFTGRRTRRHTALADVSLTVPAGHTTAIVGESGAGKTTLVRLLAGLERPTTGTIRIHGAPLRLRPGRTSPVQMVFQNPADALDPMRSIGASIAEPLRCLPRRRRGDRVAELLSLVGINPDRAGERPRGFSGGQLQRIVIARALAPEPDVLLCDEPTSALDASVQAQILNLLLDLQQRHDFAAVIVTHDLAVARVLADDVLVLRRGQVLFHGDVDTLLDPATVMHNYVHGLVQASRDTELAAPGPQALDCAS